MYVSSTSTDIVNTCIFHLNLEGKNRIGVFIDIIYDLRSSRWFKRLNDRFWAEYINFKLYTVLGPYIVCVVVIQRAEIEFL